MLWISTSPGLGNRLEALLLPKRVEQPRGGNGTRGDLAGQRLLGGALQTAMAVGLVETVDDAIECGVTRSGPTTHRPQNALPAEAPQRLSRMREQYLAGRLPPQTLTMLCHHVMGKPKEQVEHAGGVTISWEE